MDQRCEGIKDQNEKSASSMRLANKLLELNCNILENLKDKLEPSIEHLIKATYENKFHWCLCLFLDPLYAENPK